MSAWGVAPTRRDSGKAGSFNQIWKAWAAWEGSASPRQLCRKDREAWVLMTVYRVGVAARRRVEAAVLASVSRQSRRREWIWEAIERGGQRARAASCETAQLGGERRTDFSSRSMREFGGT